MNDITMKVIKEIEEKKTRQYIFIVEVGYRDHYFYSPREAVDYALSAFNSSNETVSIHFDTVDDDTELRSNYPDYCDGDCDNCPYEIDEDEEEEDNE